MTQYSWSYSSFSAAVRCLREFKLAYVDKLQVDAAEVGDLIFGTTLHAALNAALRGKDGKAVFSALWDTYNDADVEYGRFKWQELRNLGEEFLRKFSKMHLDRYELRSAENRMVGTWAGVRIEGTPDFVGLYRGRPSVRDFKTAGYNYTPEKSAVALQLHLYAELAKQNGFDYPETLGYVVFNKGTGSIQDLTWDFNQEKHEELLNQFTAYVGVVEIAALTSGPFPKNPNACLMPRRCRFFDVCYPKED